MEDQSKRGGSPRADIHVVAGNNHSLALPALVRSKEVPQQSLELVCPASIAGADIVMRCAQGPDGGIEIVCERLDLWLAARTQSDKSRNHSENVLYPVR